MFTKAKNKLNKTLENNKFMLITIVGAIEHIYDIIPVG
jgi:hypothetical protein